MATKTRHRTGRPSGHETAIESSITAPDHTGAAHLGVFSPGVFSRVTHRTLIVYCCVAALSIAAAQVTLVFSMLYWLALKVSVYRRGAPLEVSPGGASRTSSFVASNIVYTAPIVSWCLICFLTSFTGIDVPRSLVESSKTAVFFILPLVVYTSLTIVPLTARQLFARIENYIVALIFGQCLAAVHTIFSHVLPAFLPEKIPGPLTESGQLVLVIPLVVMSGLYALSSNALRENLNVSIFGKALNPQLYAGLLFLALLIVAWPGVLPGDTALAPLRIAALAVAGLLAVPPLRRGAPAMRRKLGSPSRVLHLELFQLVWPASALLFAALLINLKRGPWLGVFFELVLLGSILSRRLLVWSVALCVLVVVAVPPARSRLASFSEHFFISGGRMEMWELGEEISQRFPLGLGLNNARYMRELDPSIPEAHRHMHNNALNVLVETGWIGLAVYCWWIYAMISYGIRIWSASRGAKERLIRQSGAVALAVSIALIGWQLAGVFENNFGDGEIRLIALFYMGILLALGRFVAYGSCEATANGDPAQ